MSRKEKNQKIIFYVQKMTKVKLAPIDPQHKNSTIVEITFS